MSRTQTFLGLNRVVMRFPIALNWGGSVKNIVGYTVKGETSENG